MTYLRRQDDDYELDVLGAMSACVGRHAPFDEGHAQFASSDPATSEGSSRSPWAILPSERSTFIAALLSCWAQNRCAFLVPSRELFERLDQRLVPISLDSPIANGKTEIPRVKLLAEQHIATLLTSGSTGLPQRFEKNARQLFGEALLQAELLSLDANACVLSTTAAHHVYGLLFSLLAPWAAGAKIVVDPKNEPDAFHPSGIAELVARHGVTHLVTVPAHLRALLEAPIELSPVKRVVCSAAALDPEVARRVEERFQVEVIDIMGSTETGGIATRRPRLTTRWQPLPGVRVSLGHDELLEVRSPFLETPDQAYVSGDRAMLHEDGTFSHLGRADGVVKIAGKRSSHQEIETIAKQVPGVRDAFCSSRPTTVLRGHELLLAVEADDLDKTTLRRALRARLDAVFVPRKIRIVPELPRTDRGKLAREDILALFSPQRAAATAPSEASSSAIERVVVPVDSKRFEGHFRTDPILPALAQLTDIILPNARKHFGGGALEELSRVKWTEPLRPGSQVDLYLEQRGQTSEGRRIRFELRTGPEGNSKLACSGMLSLSHAKDES